MGYGFAHFYDRGTEQYKPVINNKGVEEYHGNPSISTAVSIYMMSLQKRKVRWWIDFANGISRSEYGILRTGEPNPELIKLWSELPYELLADYVRSHERNQPIPQRQEEAHGYENQPIPQKQEGVRRSENQPAPQRQEGARGFYGHGHGHGHFLRSACKNDC